MGQFLSKFNSKAIDGLGMEALPGPRPTEASLVKLRQLLRGVVNYQPDHIAPVLVSLYFLGYTPEQLTHTYDTIADSLVEWPEEDPIADSIGDETMLDFMGKKEYQKRYFEFFRDQLTEYTDWYEILNTYLPDLSAGLLGSDFGPLNQLSVAVEIDDPVLAMHALAWAASTDRVPLVSGSSPLTPLQLVQGCSGGVRVAAQSICELKLKGKSFSSHLDVVLNTFSHHITIKSGDVEPFDLPEQWDSAFKSLEHEPMAATRLRADVFAYRFIQLQ